MEDKFIPIDRLEFIDIGALTTTTTTPTTTTTTTTEPPPPPPTCNDCDPPLSTSYLLTFSNLGGIFAEYNGSHVVTNVSGCKWRLVESDYLVILDRFGESMVVQLYLLGRGGVNDIIWNKLFDECEMVTSMSGPGEIAGCRSDNDIDACVASVNASVSIAEV
jgi:hypothetical protein